MRLGMPMRVLCCHGANTPVRLMHTFLCNETRAQMSVMQGLGGE